MLEKKRNGAVIPLASLEPDLTKQQGRVDEEDVYCRKTMDHLN